LVSKHRTEYNNFKYLHISEGAISLEVKLPGREADHSPPPSAEANNAWSYISIPSIRLPGVMIR